MCIRDSAETEELTGKTDTIATANPKTYTGFTLDRTVEGTVASGNIAGDGSLVLKLYYTRNSYDVTYALSLIHIYLQTDLPFCGARPQAQRAERIYYPDDPYGRTGAV